MSETERVSTTVTMSPPKYQVTIPKEVRQALDVENEKALLELDVRLVKVLNEDEDEQ